MGKSFVDVVYAFLEWDPKGRERKERTGNGKANTERLIQNREKESQNQPLCTQRMEMERCSSGSRRSSHLQSQRGLIKLGKLYVQ